MLVRSVVELGRALEKAGHVLVLVGGDVDGVAALSVASALLRAEGVSYSVQAVRGLAELRGAVADHAPLPALTLLLNCGAALPLLEDLRLPDDSASSFWLLDSARPIHLDNVFDQRQVHVVVREEEVAGLGLPDFDQVYEESSDEEEEEEEEDGEEENEEPSDAKRRRRDPAARALKVAAREKWRQKRHELVNDYYLHSYISHSSALLLYDLALSQSRASVQLLWAGLVGLSSQFLAGQINKTQYELEGAEGRLRAEVKRQCRSDDASGAQTRIECSAELNLPAFKHWSLVESLRHSPIAFAAFRLFEVQGASRLDAFLARLGLPKVQCRQLYSGMRAELRKELRDSVQAHMEEFPKLKELLYKGFEGSFAFAHKLSALDAAAAASAALHASEPGRLCLEAALSTLSLADTAAHKAHLELWKLWLGTAKAEVCSALAAKSIVYTKNFFLYSLPATAASPALFASPALLDFFTRFLIRAIGEQPRMKNLKTRPLVVEVGLEGGEWSLVYGVPPLSTQLKLQRPTSFLPQVFAVAAEKSWRARGGGGEDGGAEGRVAWPAFVPGLVQIRSDHLQAFRDSLRVLLDAQDF